MLRGFRDADAVEPIEASGAPIIEVVDGLSLDVRYRSTDAALPFS